MSRLDLVLSLVPEAKLDELARRLAPETRRALADGKGEQRIGEIAQAVWQVLEKNRTGDQTGGTPWASS